MEQKEDARIWNISVLNKVMEKVMDILMEK